MKGDILMSSGKVYIRGHATRSNEVIAKLESLGGINNSRYSCSYHYFYYFILEDNSISRCDINDKPKGYTEILLDEPTTAKDTKLKARLGRKQDRVILDDNNFAYEICSFTEKYKYLAPSVVDFLNNLSSSDSIDGSKKEPTITREQVELKVVEYAKSVNWDFEKVLSFSVEPNYISHNEWLTLDGKTHCDKVQHIFDRYKPKEDGYKQSENKLSYELDWNFITQMAERMEVNKGKYKPYNWKKPIDTQELRNAITRHAIEVAKGNFSDDGRPFGHLEALACNSMMLNFQLNNKE